ncbi:putative mannitol dehydrogenase [Zopfochytrium polystomum]|nr:putative mannitol dehydrogenase [Zopfochytrium polystomum]
MAPPTASFHGFACKGKDQPMVPFSYTPRPLGANDVEVEISHCGICGSDIHTIDSGWGPTRYPVIPGHEIVGKVVATGSAVSSPAVGTLVGIGAAVFACNECDLCLAGDDNYCSKRVWTYGDVYPDPATGSKASATDADKSYGGYASHVRVHAKWAVPVPEGIAPEHAAPLMCAGVTVFAPLRRILGGEPGAGAGKKVGVAGIGGLGHLAVQFASKLGADVVAISHSPSKKAEATSLGARDFCVLADPADYARVAGTLDVLIITTFYAHESLDRLLALLRVRHGHAVLLALPESPLALSGGALVPAGRTLSGSAIGSVAELRATLEFAAAHGVRPFVEVTPMEQVNEAIGRVRKGSPRYRVVLERTDKTFAA